jgi:hypothetical protein
MPYVRLGDEEWRHPGRERLKNLPGIQGLAAIGMWTDCLSFVAGASAQGDRSGVIGRKRVTAIIMDDPTELAALLVDAGLWEEVEDGWRFVDMEKRLPPVRDVETQRANGRKGGQARARNQASRQASRHDSEATSLESASKTPSKSPGLSSDMASDTPSEIQARATGTGTGSKGSTTSTVTKRTPARTTSGQQAKQEALIEGGEPKPSTPAARARTLTQRYVELVPLSNFAAVQGIVRKAISANYDDAKISSGLSALAAEGGPVTTDALRVQMEGLPANGRARGHRPYQNPPTSAYTER